MPAHAPYFIVYDKSGKILDIVQNPYRVGPAAGPKTAEFISGLGVKMFVAESFGAGRMSVILNSSGIKTVIFHGTADEAAKKLIKK